MQEAHIRAAYIVAASNLEAPKKAFPEQNASLSTVPLIPPKLYANQPHLPRNPGEKPAGMTDPGRGWLACSLGDIGGMLGRLPSGMDVLLTQRTDSAVHWIQPV